MNTRLTGHWNLVTNGTRGDDIPEFCRKLETLPEGNKARFWQAGDNPGDGIRLNRADCVAIAEASNHLDRPFGYTHYRPTQFNLRILKAMAKRGLTMNLSADNVGEADRFVETGLPVCVTLPEDYPATLKTPAGNRIVICPEQLGKVDTCENCMLCATPRNYVIGFIAHGNKAKLIENH